MTNGKDDVSDPFQKLYAALDEDMAGPGAKRAAFKQDPHGTLGQRLTQKLS